MTEPFDQEKPGPAEQAVLEAKLRPPSATPAREPVQGDRAFVAFMAFVCLMVALALGSFIAYHFVKLHDYHEQKMQRDCYYYGAGHWDNGRCVPWKPPHNA